VFGNSGMSPSEGKLGAGLAGGRRLLTRGTSASAIRKSVNGRASQFDICTAAPAWAGTLTLFYDATKPLNRCLSRKETPSRLPVLDWGGTVPPDEAARQFRSVPSERRPERPADQWSWAEPGRRTPEWPFPRVPGRLVRPKGPRSRLHLLRRLCPPARRCGERFR
jgi:hypothetical protein